MLRKSGAPLAVSNSLSYPAVGGAGADSTVGAAADGQVDLLNMREAPCALLNAMRASGPVRRYFQTFRPMTPE